MEADSDKRSPWGADEPLVIGVLYPRQFHPDEADWHEEIDRLSALDRRVEVVVEPYVEGSALRTRRSVPGFVPGDDDRTPVTDAQRQVLGRIDVALALDLPFDTPALAPRLRWVQAVGSGVGQLATAGLSEGGIRLTNAAGTSAPEIAEFVLARVLEHAKRLPELRATQAAVEWRPLYGRGLAGATIGLVGLGAINAAVARLARAFGMRVVACRRSPGEPHPDVADLYAPEGLTGMVGECDYVVAAVPETPATIGLFDAEAFAAMASGAFFVNVGRGSAVVDDALLAAIRSGHLGGAALDVFDAEPLPADHPYWREPGVVVSAHCSSVPSASIARVHDLFRDNVARFLAGEPLRNPVELGG